MPEAFSASYSMTSGHRDEQRTQMRKLLVLRSLIALVLIGVGILILYGQETAPVFPLAAILVGTLLVSPLFWIALGKGSSISFLVAALATMDVLLETVLVHYTGGAFSQFTLLYFLSIVSGSVFYQLRGTLFIATLATVSYVGVVVAEAAGVVPSALAAPVAALDAGWVIWFHAGLNVLTFYVIAFLSGQLSLKVERRRRLLETAAEELRAARLDTGQILENLASGLVTLDSDGRVVHANRAAAAILGVDVHSATGGELRVALGAGCAELCDRLEASLRERRALARVELSIRGAGGETIPLGLSTSLLTRNGGGSEGDLRGLVAIFQDLTESRRIEESLRRADRMAAVAELSAGVAHEIRNPLASICGAAQILESELSVSGEEARLLKLVVREADRLNRFLGDFLAFSRSRPRRLSLVSVVSLLEDVRMLTESHPRCSAGIAVEIDVPEEEHFIEADAEEIKRVFLNLAQNAVEAMGSEGRLTLRVRGPIRDEAKGEMIRVEFRDTGPGVSEADAPNLFKPFVSGKKGGTGLGLAIAQRIVEEHGGSIQCESVPGRGASFVVTLPGVVVSEEAAVRA